MPKPIENEFNNLRQRARAKRDKALAEIKAEYAYQLTQIAKLEQDLLGKVSSRYHKISAAIESVIPRDRSFSVLDIFTALEALDPRRPWRRRSVDNHLTRLRERGIIRRIRRSTIHEPALYVRAEHAPPPGPMDDKSLFQAIGQVHKAPMSTTEILIAVVEAGYNSTMSRNNLRNAIAGLMRRHGYKADAGRWLP
jgi:hypothetical protein